MNDASKSLTARTIQAERRGALDLVALVTVAAFYLVSEYLGLDLPAEARIALSVMGTGAALRWAVLRKNGKGVD